MVAVETVSEGLRKLDVNGKPIRKVAGNARVVLGDITPHNILQLKALHNAIFPFNYNDKFYTEVRGSGELTRLAYFNDVVVGAVTCRINNSTDKKSLYIMTFGVLPVYRQFGIGTELINYTLQLAEKDESIKTISLHVHIDNQLALNFYKKHGFEQQELVENYYELLPSIDMKHEAYSLVKKIRD
ncbi:unnamed protein product [Caenorhabditis angaria]|uniref:N-terminal methionine N(alpha)-acetyltransferase NatE n=1 Tax=Caenorhabditis angaria TaxID=860376 RepID=A0A9P1MXU3_9PELO|nr:unnamed protein product [Caenorhabditis angaria]